MTRKTQYRVWADDPGASHAVHTRAWFTRHIAVVIAADYRAAEWADVRIQKRSIDIGEWQNDENTQSRSSGSAE